MKNVSLLMAFLALTQYAFSQVVYTEPAFPSQFDDVTVYFDATQGNGGLQGFTGDIYAHTGVITSASNSPTDWKYVQGQWGVEFPRTLMKAEGNDLYSIAFNINEFYGVPDGEEVLQLAFVFRNVDGSITGRAEDGSDIYSDVYPPEQGLLLTVFAPQEDGQIIYADDSLYVQFALNDSANVTIEDNGAVVFSDSTESDNFFISNPDLGSHTLVFTVENGLDTVSIQRSYFVLEENGAIQDSPFEVPLGHTYYTDSTYVFQLYAPGKEHVFLLCSANNYEVDLDFQLKKATDAATFWIEVDRNLFDDKGGTYQYLVDGDLKIADPYSRVVLDPFNDAFVPADVMAELPSYPDGLTNGVVTAFDLEDEEFPWRDFEGYEIPDQSNIVVYELLMRDFLADRNYKSLIDTLDYLEDLGVTAIELMPIQEFEGNQSWGYNPSFHMAVDKYYGSRRQLKMVVDEAHQRGIAVILDVVYNHVFSQSPLAQLYWDAQNFRPTEENPWLNVTPKHPFNVGYDVNHESEASKTWVKQTLKYWMAEFHIDGFRFDLSKGFTQFNSGSNSDLMSQPDASRIAILKDYADHVWSINPEAYVILEHFAYNEEEVELANYGMMLWGNMHFEFTKAVKEQNSSLGWLDHKERGWNDPHLVGYMESHDEERLMVELLNSGFSLERALERIETASALMYLVPGPKMLWQFGELGFDYSINWCVNGTVNGCRLDPKPIVWDYLENEERAELRDVVSNILHLKKTYPTFATDDYDFNDTNLDLKTIQFNHEEMDALVMVNFRDEAAGLIPKFQYPGTWYEYFTGDSIEVVDVEERIPLISGEYRIYTSKRITPVNGSTTSVNEVETLDVEVWPNPVYAGQVIHINGSSDARDIFLMDQMGRVIKYEQNEDKFRLPSEISSGIYYLRVSSQRGYGVLKIFIE